MSKYNSGDEDTNDVCRRIVAAVLTDLSSRAGISDALDEIDDEIYAEIVSNLEWITEVELVK